MDLSSVGSPHEIGDVVKLSYGDWAPKDSRLVQHEGEVGTVIGLDYHDCDYRSTMDPDPANRSVDIIKLTSGKIIREHWICVRRAHPLEALGSQADTDTNTE